MILYVNGQDIKTLVIGTVDEQANEPPRVISETAPEAYLSHIDDFLKGSHKEVSDVEKIFVVVGPGSATALRAILSIVNTMKFAAGVDLVGVEKPMLEDDRETLRKINEGQATLVKDRDFLAPIYAYAPRITRSKKDVLKRATNP